MALCRGDVDEAVLFAKVPEACFCLLNLFKLYLELPMVLIVLKSFNWPVAL